MTYTSSIPVLCGFLKDKLEANQVALGLIDIYYGDQARIPRTPAACVEPGGKDRTLNGAPRRTQVDVTIYILVYHAPLQSAETTREQDDLIAEAIETLIHADNYFKDLTNMADPDQVIDSMVRRIESGYQMRANTMFRASRLTIEARVQEQLPQEV